jgi:hypothetical protein
VERIREQQVASGKEIEGLCEGLMQRAFAGEIGGVVYNSKLNCDKNIVLIFQIVSNQLN